MIKTNIEKGDIFYAVLSPVIGSEQGGERPVVVVQNNLGNEYNPTVIVAPLTKILKKRRLPMHVFIPKNPFLRFDSQILLEQVRTLDKSRISNYLGSLSESQIQLIDNALIETFNIDIIEYLRFKGIGGESSSERKRLYSNYYYKKN